MSAAAGRESFSAFEKRGWEESADAYHRYFGPLTAQAADALLDAVTSDSRRDSLLDLACGPGELAILAMKRGFRKVVGLDFSSAMIAAARARKSRVEFKQGDVEQIKEPDGSFDAVAMNFGLLHLARPAQAIAEAFRVLKSGGVFAFTVWAPPEKALGFRIILAAINTHADKQLTIPEGPPFFHYGDVRNCEAALAEAGFASSQVKDVPLVWALESGEALFDAFLTGTARTGGLMRMQSVAALEAMKRAVVAGCERFRIDDHLRIPMCAVLAVGNKA